MKESLVYKNLNTSFVNLAALVRFLRGRQFAGKISVEIGEYAGEIAFSAEGELRASEYDRASGRIAEGEDALHRLLIRAKEAGGIINVEPLAIAATNDSAENSDVNSAADQQLDVANIAAVSPIVPAFRPATVPVETPQFIETQNSVDEKRRVVAVAVPDANSNLVTPDLPLEFTNKVEAKARQNQLSDEDWETLTDLLAEILRTIDESLAESQLNFSAAFRKACAEISADYPFLNPQTENFSYADGQIVAREKINAKLFTAAINEALRLIFDKLAANPGLDEIHRATVQKVIALVHRRKSQYDQFFITPQLEKNLGI